MPILDPGFIVAVIVWVLSTILEVALIVIVVVLTLRWVFGVDLRRLTMPAGRDGGRTDPRRVTVNRRDRPLRL